MKQDSNLRVISQSDQNIVIMEGMLDHDFARNLVPLAEKLSPPIVFDMEQVSLITAAGSRVLLAFYQHFEVKPIVRGANQHVLNLLKLTGTIRYVELAEPSANKAAAKN